MSLLTDLIAYVNSFDAARNAQLDAAVNALIASVNSEAVMISAAQDGNRNIQLPFNTDVIAGMYKNMRELQDIENRLVERLKLDFPEIEFYKDKYKPLNIYAKWLNYPVLPDGPVR